MEPVQRGITSFFGGIPEVKEVVHTWVLNPSTNINLTRIQSNLDYEVVDSKEGVLFNGKIEIPESKTIEEMITHLKKCKVSLNPNGEVRFLFCYHSWSIGFKEASLVKATEGLMWNIFCTSTRQCSLFSILESTIPSARCHPETIARIERIKNEGLNRGNILSLINDFTISRILDEETIVKELIKLEEYKEKLSHDKYSDLTTILANGLAGGVWTAFAACDAMIGTSIGISSYLGGGLLGSIAGGCVGLTLGAFAFSAGSVLCLSTGTSWILTRQLGRGKQKGDLDNRIDILLSPPQQYLFVEIEPISAPSSIDSRIRVSKFTWAVTLITYSGSLGNHAGIVVEGINDGFYGANPPMFNRRAKPVSIGEKFTHLAHFTPNIESGLISPNELKFETRTEVWMRSSDKVKAMLRSIEEEKSLPEQPFNLFGKESLSYKVPGISYTLFIGDEIKKSGNNCFTWARDHLTQVDIELGKGIFGFILTAARTYTSQPSFYEKDVPVQQI